MIYRNNVIHANCLTAMPELPAESVDFILTDPVWTKPELICCLVARDDR